MADVTGIDASPNAPAAWADGGARLLGWVERRLTTRSIALAAGLVALGLGCHQLSRPSVLTGVLGADLSYDDGVYSGVSIRLVHGAIPYRDFVFLHPPGIAYLLAPSSLLGLVAGSHATLVLDRCLTVVVVAANAALAGWLLRSLGRVAVAASSFALALWPLAVSVDRGVELEPYLVFFCLLGAIVLFGRGDEPSRRRLLVAGVLFGVAAVVKVWALLPMLAALAVWLPRRRHHVRWLALGMLAGIAVPCLPFFLAAPHAFVHQVVADQLGRQTTLPTSTFAQRLSLIAGVTGLSAFSVADATVVVGSVLFLGMIVVAFGSDSRRCSRLEWYTLAAAGITFVGMFKSPVLFDHYAYFPAAMTAPLLGVCAARLRRTALRWLARRSSVPSDEAVAGRARARSAGVLLAVLAVAVGAVVFAVEQDAAYADGYLVEPTGVSAIAQVIPPGSCVLFDYPTELIAADRFASSKPGCPALVDPFGMFVAYDGDIPHLAPPALPIEFQFVWLGYLQQADYVVLHVPYSDYIPWGAYMIRWFSQNYRLAAHLPIDETKDIYIYRRSG